MLLATIAGLAWVVQSDSKLPEWAQQVMMEAQNSGFTLVNPWGFSGRHGYPPNRWNSAVGIYGAIHTGQSAVEAFRKGAATPDSELARDQWARDPSIVSSWSVQIPDLIRVAKEVRVNIERTGENPDAWIRSLYALRPKLAEIAKMASTVPSRRAIDAIADLRRRGWLKSSSIETLSDDPKLLRQNYAAATGQAIKEVFTRRGFPPEAADDLCDLIREFRLPLRQAGWLQSPDIEDDLIFAIRARQKGELWPGEKYLLPLLEKPIRVGLLSVPRRKLPPSAADEDQRP